MQREFPDHPIVGVGAVIFDDRNRVLLVRRASPPLEGAWSVPGGALELGETLRRAAEREALEETGLRVEAGDVVEVFDSIFPTPVAPEAASKEVHGSPESKSHAVAAAPQYHYVIIDFLCRLAGGDLLASSDAAEARWFARDELDALDLSIPMQRVLARALEMIEQIHL